MNENFKPGGAVRELLQEDGEIDRLMERGLTFDAPPPAPPAPPPGPSIHEILAADPPDWEAERLERLQRDREQERQERARIVAAELERIAADQPPEPAAPRPAPRRTWRRSWP